MKSLKKLRLVDMNKDELQKKTMSELRGGNGDTCGCGCAGTANVHDNGMANALYGLGENGTESPCSCVCFNDVFKYGEEYSGSMA